MLAAVKVLLASLRSTLTAEAERWVFWARWNSGDKADGNELRSKLPRREGVSNNRLHAFG